MAATAARRCRIASPQGSGAPSLTRGRADHADWRGPLDRAPAPPGAAFTAPPITLPHGATIEAMRTTPERIVLQVDLADGSVELVEIDLATGRLVTTIPLKEAP